MSILVLLHSPEDVIQKLLIALTLGVQPPATPWGVYAPYEPDKPADVITVQPSEGIDNFRNPFDGITEGHYGIQIRVRSADVDEGSAKARAIHRAICGVLRRSLVIGANTYFIQSFVNISQVIPLGLEKAESQQVSKRSIFVINCLVHILREV